MSIVYSVMIPTMSLLGQAEPVEDARRAVTLDPEVPASVNDDGGALRCEPTVAVHADNIVVAWNDSYGGAHGSKTGVIVGWSYSTNGGRSYRHGGYLPEPDPAKSLGSADARLAADRSGNFYLAVLVWHDEGHEIRTYFMDRNTIGAFKPLRTADATNGSPLIDKPALTVWGSDRLALAYTRGRDIAVAVSENGGRDWLDPRVVSDSDNTLRTGAAVSATGTIVTAAWLEGHGMKLNELWAATSTDGGHTFKEPVRVHRLAAHVAPLSGYAMGLGRAAFMANDAALAVTTAGSDRFYLACLEGTRSGSRILLFTSQGKPDAWSEPVAIGYSPDAAGKAFLSMTLAGGTPALLYYDRRNSVDTARTDVYLSVMTASNRFDDVRVNTVAGDWSKTPGDRKHAPFQRNLGDYITLASDGYTLVAAWTCGRTGLPRIFTRTIKCK